MMQEGNLSVVMFQHLTRLLHYAAVSIADAAMADANMDDDSQHVRTYMHSIPSLVPGDDMAFRTSCLFSLAFA